MEGKNLGLKYDEGKPDYNLIPPNALEGLAKVLTYGANKYGPTNYKLVTPKSRYISATFRHIEAYRKGEILDQESGLQHLYHAISNLIILSELDSKDEKILPKKNRKK